MTFKRCGALGSFCVLTFNGLCAPGDALDQRNWVNQKRPGGKRTLDMRDVFCNNITGKLSGAYCSGLPDDTVVRLYKLRKAQKGSDV